jgi:hypothetical protein
MNELPYSVNFLALNGFLLVKLVASSQRYKFSRNEILYWEEKTDI